MSDPFDCLIAIDCAGDALSLALCRQERCLASVDRSMTRGHAEHLLPAIATLFEQAGLVPGALTGAVAVRGPGSFTGIRTALAAAHGLALARDVPVFGVTRGAALVAALIARGGPASGWSRVLAVTDSRRAHPFIELLGPDGRALEPPAVCPETLPEADAVIGDIASLGDRAGPDMRVPIAATAADAARALRCQYAASPPGQYAASPPASLAATPLYIRAPDVTPAH